MILPDLNLLVYAYNADALEHPRAKTWWETCLSDSRPVGLPWAVISPASSGSTLSADAR